MTKPHLSASSLEMLAKCPKQYEFRYVEGIRRPPRAVMLRGTATHHAIQADLQHKIDTGELLAEEAVQETAARMLDVEWAATEVEFAEGEDPKQAKGQAKDEAVRLATLHHTVLAPRIQPDAVERELLLELEGFAFNLKGYVDIVAEGGTVVRDTKTRGKPPGEDDARDSLQAAIYPAMLEQIDGKRPERFVLDALVAQKTQVQAVSLDRKVEPDDTLLVRRLEIASRQIEAGLFPPTSPGSWWCSRNWCGYWERCEFGARHRSQHVKVDTHKEKR